MPVIAAMSASVLGRNKGMVLGKDIMEGYSECHWPGGQLRVSTPNFMVEIPFNLPKG
jgi:hypothetical protein